MLPPQQARHRFRRVSSHIIELASSLDELINDLLSESIRFLCVDKVPVWLVNDIDSPTHLNCTASTDNALAAPQNLQIIDLKLF